MEHLDASGTFLQIMGIPVNHYTSASESESGLDLDANLSLNLNLGLNQKMNPNQNLDSFWMDLGASGSISELLEHSGTFWESLGSPSNHDNIKCFVAEKEPLGVSGSFWEHVGARGSIWELHLQASGSIWELLGAFGNLANASGTIWELLANYGNTRKPLYICI